MIVMDFIFELNESMAPLKLITSRDAKQTELNYARIIYDAVWEHRSKSPGVHIRMGTAFIPFLDLELVFLGLTKPEAKVDFDRSEPLPSGLRERTMYALDLYSTLWNQLEFESQVKLDQPDPMDRAAAIYKYGIGLLRQAGWGDVLPAPSGMVTAISCLSFCKIVGRAFLLGGDPNQDKEAVRKMSRDVTTIAARLNCIVDPSAYKRLQALDPLQFAACVLFAKLYIRNLPYRPAKFDDFMDALLEFEKPLEPDDEDLLFEYFHRVMSHHYGISGSVN